ncbi:MAG: hypothetical protein R3F59_04735 [Myxococcota bacterium]
MDGRIGFGLGFLFAALAACTGTDGPSPPCADGWGAITAPDSATHVRTDGDDASADGSADLPYATVAAAIDAGATHLALGPGDFPATLALGATDSLVLQGCSADETRLVGDTASAPILSLNGTAGVIVSGVTLAEADRPLFATGGATVTADHVAIRDGNWSGFVVDGPYTVVELEDVTVADTRSVGGAGGFGGEVDGATLRWTGGELVGNRAAGLVAAGSSAVVELTDVRVADTAPADDGRFGRGIQLQDFASASLTDLVVADNHDAGVFSLLAADLVVDGLTVSGTTASAAGGDALVVTAVDADGRQLDPAGFRATLTGNTVDGADRAGIVLERVTATVDGNTVANAPQAIVAQQDAVVSGADPVDVLTEPLPLERAAIAGIGAP